MEFRINWDGVATGGLGGFVKNPLGWVPLGEKALSVHRQPKKAGRTAQLLLLYRTAPPMGRGLQELYPKAGLHVEILE